MYVDDLISNDESRSKGHGKKLLEWLEDYARQDGCDELHLDSGVQRFDAHRFYQREGMHISCHHFAKGL
jgi:GNAT superfamily N-acetyltransferase